MTPKHGNILRPFLLAVFAWTWLASGISLAQSPPPERPLRAVWLESRSAELRSERNCRDLVEALREINVDDIFVEVRSMGDAYYLSDFVPTPTGLEPGFRDPLGAILAAAQRPGVRPIRIHAVLNLFRVHNNTFPLDPPEHHVMIANPEWVGRDFLGNTHDKQENVFLDPAVPAVQDHLTSVVLELVQKYPVDGVHFVDYRYPSLEGDWGYNQLALKRYNIEMEPSSEKPDPQDPKWLEWRSSELTRYLKVLGETVREANPEAAISVSALASGSPPSEDSPDADYIKALQNWPEWARRDLFDIIVLENYHSQERAAKEYVAWIRFAQSQKEDAKLLVGISGAHNFDSAVLMQMRVAMAYAADGVLLHTYQKPALNLVPGVDFMALLGRTVFSPQYSLPAYVYESILSASPVQVAESIEGITLGTVASPVALPAPIPITEVTETPQVSVAAPAPSTPARPSAAAAGLALLGIDASQYSPPSLQGRNNGRDERLADFVPGRDIEPVHTDWLRVTLVNGTSFIARIVHSDGDATVFQVRHSRVEMTLPSSRIQKMEPDASTSP